MSKRKFFSGNSVRQAVVSAASHFDLPPDEVAYREVDKKHGFLKMRKRVIIEVDADDPRTPPEGWCRRKRVFGRQNRRSTGAAT